MSTMQGHTLSYKLQDGTWINIPVLVQDMYDTYVKACAEAEEPIEPVDRDTYLKGLVDFIALARELTELGSVIAIEHGGTGAETAVGARTNLDVYSKEETTNVINNALYGEDTPEGEEAEGSLVARIRQLEKDVSALKAFKEEIETARANKTLVTLLDIGIDISDNAPSAAYNPNATIVFEY